MGTLGGGELADQARGRGIGADTASLTGSPRSSERWVLGEALRARESDVLQCCQAAFVRQASFSHDEVSANPLWELLSIAVNAIVDWLTAGNVAGESDKSRIASLGSSVATYQVASGTFESGDRASASRPSETSPS